MIIGTSGPDFCQSDLICQMFQKPWVKLQSLCLPREVAFGSVCAVKVAWTMDVRHSLGHAHSQRCCRNRGSGGVRHDEVMLGLLHSH